MSADWQPLPQVTISEEDRINRQRELVQSVLSSVAVVVAWFTAAGLVGALVWVKVTDLPTFTRVADNGSMGEEQLGKQFAVSGWFLVIAVVGGLVSGLVLLLLRRSSPPLVLVPLVALGGGLATLLMVQCGLAWGPGDPNAALLKAPLGAEVPTQLKADVNAVFLAWSVAALLGAALSLWLQEARENARRRREVEYPQLPLSADYSG